MGWWRSVGCCRSLRRRTANGDRFLREIKGGGVDEIHRIRPLAVSLVTAKGSKRPLGVEWSARVVSSSFQLKEVSNGCEFE